MQAVQFDTEILDGLGYGYIVIPGKLLDYPAESVWVRLTMKGVAEIQRTTPLQDGSHRVELNRELLYNLGLKVPQSITIQVERVEVPPMINDMPADFLTAMRGPALEEDFKRLPPETQRRYFEQIESASPETRPQVIRSIIRELLAVRGDLPHGDSL